MNPLYATEFWLRLVLTPGLGCRSQIALLRRFGSPGAALQARGSELRDVLRDSQITALQTAAERPEWPELEAHQAWLAETDNHMLVLGDPDYPSCLLDLPDPPSVLFAKGKAALLSTRCSLAVVGSRQATPQGQENAELFSATLSRSGVTIVSGLAAGIDAAAHRGGLAGEGSTIAVVGTGLDRIYPARNRDLAHAIASHGVLISEFPLGCPPLADNFPRRNRLIAALGQGCLVVEATLGSGSLITAKQAAEIGREVFAIPGSIHSPQSKGCHRLIKDGAKLVEDAKDIYDELALPELPGIKSSSSPAHPDDPLLEQIGWEPVDIETLSVRCNQEVSGLSAHLLELELAGKIHALPGGRYQRCA